MSRVGPVLVVLLALAVVDGRAASPPVVTVGSKNFTESYLLAEITAQLLEHAGIRVERRFGLGGTLICLEALVAGEIDVYIEYTGTITEAISAFCRPRAVGARRAAGGDGLRTLPELGFDNSYALAMDADAARERGIERISDLVGSEDLEFAFSHEFIEREDGWRGLKEVYGFTRTPPGIEHGLAYQAIAEDRIDVTDAYATDGDLERYGLAVLQDDRDFFPRYAALPLVRSGFRPEAEAALKLLDGRIDSARMRALNARVVVDRRTFEQVAAAFLEEEGLVVDPVAASRLRSDLVGNTLAHLRLTGVALLCAVLVGLPLGILVHRSRRASGSVLYTAGLLQTIPSIALLALLIPVLGIGWAPALVALFLYSLLPILRNTVTALLTVDPVLRRVAVGMGLGPVQQIRWLLLPMALPGIMAGIRTAAVISIGTATLAAFVGAGGLAAHRHLHRAPDDPALILEGAIPAAMLAIVTELLFELLSGAIPVHLRRDPLRTD
ncbi:MAG: glycine betaine ABC transporter substrate-binding protein [Gammaproteobacteria bacterium]|nr:glycine betaine ABC transporter substrate-binding protein [Gammaproteobacteria bacterium]